MVSTTEKRTSGALRRVRRGALVLGALLLGALSAAAPAAALPSPAGLPAGAQVPAGTVSVPAGKNLESVQVYDTAEGSGVLNQNKIRQAVEQLDFKKPTRVVVYTRDGLYEDNINTKTLLFAREEHLEWISSSDSDKWADGYFIITVSIEQPSGGQVGTYFGEDIKLDSNPDAAFKAEQEIQAAGRSNFKARNWTAGVIDVAQAAADRMNRQWFQDPALLWPVGIGVGVVGVGAGGIALSRSNNRSRFSEALDAGSKSLTAVTMDLDNTEISARALPATGSTIAADLESRFQKFMTGYRSLVTEQEALQATDKKQRSGGETRKRAETFRDGAAELDSVDDSISAAAALYARTAGWEQAWRAQVAPFEEDLAGVPGIVNQANNMDFGFFGGGDNAATMQSASAALSSWASGAQQRVQDLNAQMTGGGMDTDAALEQLRALRTELSQQLQRFAEIQIEIFSKNDSEREAMRDEMHRSMGTRRARGSILDTLAPRLFWSSYGYSQGYSSGTAHVERSRSSSSSSGSTRGYSGGGGSFSGSGSSSRF